MTRTCTHGARLEDVAYGIAAAARQGADAADANVPVALVGWYLRG